MTVAHTHDISLMCRRPIVTLQYLKQATTVFIPTHTHACTPPPPSSPPSQSTLTGDYQKDRVKVTFGLIPKKKDHYGMMMYHKNRLIKSYEKVGCQLKVKEQTLLYNLQLQTMSSHHPDLPCLHV